MKNKNEVNIPKLRFPEFEGEWEIIKSKDLFENSRKKGNSTLPIYSVTQRKGLVPRDSLDRKMGNCANSEDNLSVKSKDLVYNMMRMWQGAVGIADKECMVSPAYIVLSPKDDISSEFFIEFFNRRRSLYLFTAYSYGLTSDRLRLYYKDFAKICFATPFFPEQEKIKTFFATINQKIQQLTHKKELLDKYKKGVMQKIFSQEIRFKDDNGQEYPDWEEKRLGEIARIVKGKGISKNDVKQEGKTQCIRYGELYTHYSEVISNVHSATNIDPLDLILSENNDVIIPSSGETHIDLATASCVLKDGIALGGDINIIRSDQDGTFLSYYLNNGKKLSIAKLAQGSSVIHLYGIHLKSLKLSLPCTQGQQKIASFLSNIDKKIEAINSKLTQTQSFKKGLLQQMFV